MSSSIQSFNPAKQIQEFQQSVNAVLAKKPSTKEAGKRALITLYKKFSTELEKQYSLIKQDLSKEKADNLSGHLKQFKNDFNEYNDFSPNASELATFLLKSVNKISYLKIEALASPIKDFKEKIGHIVSRRKLPSLNDKKAKQTMMESFHKLADQLQQIPKALTQGEHKISTEKLKQFDNDIEQIKGEISKRKNKSAEHLALFMQQRVIQLDQKIKGLQGEFDPVFKEQLEFQTHFDQLVNLLHLNDSENAKKNSCLRKASKI